MLVVLLSPSAWTQVELLDFFILRAKKKRLLATGIWGKTYTIRVFLYIKCLYYLSSLRVPVMHQFVIGPTKEIHAIRRKRQISNSFLMSVVGPDAFAVVIYIPQFYWIIETSTQDVMPILRKKATNPDLLGMAWVVVKDFLRDEALVLQGWLQFRRRQ